MRSEFLEARREGVRETPGREFLELRLQVRIVHRASKMLRNFQFAFDESFGITGFPIRFGARPEITLLELTPQH